MDGAYLPQHVRRARTDGRLLGQVRDLLVMRKTSHIRDCRAEDILFMTRQNRLRISKIRERESK